MDDIPKTWTARSSTYGNRKPVGPFSISRYISTLWGRRFILCCIWAMVAVFFLFPVGTFPGLEHTGWVAAIAQEAETLETTPTPASSLEPLPDSTSTSVAEEEQERPPIRLPKGPRKQPLSDSATDEGTRDPTTELTPDGYTSKEAITVKRKMAPVVLDGDPLFDVAAHDNISAEARANQVSAILEAWADQKQIPLITLEEGRGTTTIVLQTKGSLAQDAIKVNLITVTKADAIRDLLTPQEQAEKWVEIIDQALAKARDERNPEVLWRSIVLATVAFLMTCLTFWHIGRLQQRASQQPLKQLKRLIQGKVKRDGIPIHVRQVVLALCLKCCRYGIWIAVTFYITQLFPATRQVSFTLRRRIWSSFKTDIFPLGGESYSLIDLLILIAGFLILVVGSTLITNLLRTRILQLAGISSGAQQAIATLSRYTLIGLGTVVILQLWGLDLSSLTIIASALGVGIGFGLQNIARDFGSGLILLFERPIQVGDFIEVSHFRGTVDRIGARSTMIKTLDQVSVIVPNSYFLDNQVVNWSHDNPLSRIAIPVGVSYETDPEKVKALLLQAGTAHKGVLQIPAPQVLFKGFGDNALNFELLVWIVEPNRQPLIHSDLNFSVFNLLQENDIEIPYPQRDLHIRTGEASLLTGDQDPVSTPRRRSPLKNPHELREAQDHD